jgi:hypothetical protein
MLLKLLLCAMAIPALLLIWDLYKLNRKIIRRFHIIILDKILCLLSTKFHDESIKTLLQNDNPQIKDLQLQINLLTEDRDQWKFSTRDHNKALDREYKRGYKQGYNDCEKRK